jgi:hypothetical protein
MKKKEPKLVPIDLSKGNGHNHPDICLGKRYLAKIGGEFYTGRFSKQWYGFNFNDGWGCSGHQFDTPGTNCSNLEELYEIVKQ